MTFIGDKHSFLKFLAFAIMAGILIGVFYIWMFEPSKKAFSAGISAVVAFAIVLGTIGRIAEFKKSLTIVAGSIVAGFAGGGVWWLVAKPQVSLLVSMGIGGAVGVSLFGLTLDLLFRPSRSDTEPAN